MKELSSIDLERVYCESPQLELPPACYDRITNQYDTIPYTRYLKTLKELSIFIITLDYQDNSDTFKRIIQNIGIPHTHKEKDSFLWDIKIPEKNKTCQHLARSQKDEEFLLHTDCSYEENVPDYFALYVLHADQQSGGNNLIVDIKALIKYLSKESLEILQKIPITIHVPKEFYKGIDSIQTSIIDENLNIRYRREIIDFQSLKPEQLKALTELENLAYSKQFCRRLILKNNQILLLSNKKFLHARTKIMDKNRHLQRIRFFEMPLKSLINN